MLGIAFAGGGIRGSVELGIVKAFYEANIRPTIFTGASAGSIVAGLLAMGYSPDEAFAEFSKVGSDVMDVAYGHILSGLFSKERVQGLVRGDRLESMLNMLYCRRQMHGIPQPNKLAVVATDIQTGKQIIFANQDPVDTSMIGDDNFAWFNQSTLPISFAVRSSCSFPAVFLPKRYMDYVLVDGGLTNNVPSDIARALGATQVITIDLGYNGEKEEVGGIASIIGKSISILMERVNDHNNDTHGIYLNPSVDDVGTFDFSQMDELYQIGYRYGKAMIQEVREKLVLATA